MPVSQMCIRDRAYTAVDYLIRQGHRKIAVLGGPVTSYPSAVSYTHLDVYKRQVHSLLGLGDHGGVVLLVQHLQHGLGVIVQALQLFKAVQLCLLYTSRCV